MTCRTLRLWSLAAVATIALSTPQITCAAVPESVMKVVKVEKGIALIVNSGFVPIGAALVRTPAGNVYWGDYAGSGGLKPGATDSFSNMGEDASIANVEITTVIFQTGQVLGDRPKRLDGSDVVQEIFDYRAGQAQAWAKWKRVVDSLPSDNDAAVAQFYAEVEKIPPPSPEHLSGPVNYVQRGYENVETGLVKVMDNLKKNSAGHDSKWVREVIANVWLAPLLQDSSRKVTKEVR